MWLSEAVKAEGRGGGVGERQKYKQRKCSMAQLAPPLSMVIVMFRGQASFSSVAQAGGSVVILDAVGDRYGGDIMVMVIILEASI